MSRSSIRNLCLALVGASLILTSGCANLLQQRMAIKNCNYSLKSVAFGDLDLSGGVFKILVGVSNPNSVAAILDSLDFDFYLNESHVSKGSTRQALNVPAGEARDLPIDLRVNFSDISNLVDIIRSGKPKNYKVAGTVSLDTKLGKFALPLSVSGNF